MISNVLVSKIVCQQREYFATGDTKNIYFRIQQLKKLKQLITDNEDRIYQSLQLDIKKPQLESFAGEITILNKEIDHTLNNLKW